MICKLCGADRKLIKAHVIPAAFFEKNGNDSAFESFLHTFDLTTHSKRLPAGSYDKELLCNDCERRFQKWDDYGANLLLKKFDNFLPLWRDSELIGWRVDDYDYRLLKMFVIGVLWRAAASDHAYFIDTTIGPFEQLAKRQRRRTPGGEVILGPESASSRNEVFSPMNVLRPDNR
jgi:hypothetical protein